MSVTSVIESIRVGLGALHIHPARTLLSTLGVLIGAMALTATFAIIDGVDVMARAVLLRESSIQNVFVVPRR